VPLVKKAREEVELNSGRVSMASSENLTDMQTILFDKDEVSLLMNQTSHPGDKKLAMPRK